MLWLKINRSSKKPLYQQIYEQLVERILKGELASGTRLPGTRQLAGELKVSRNVITAVYDQLLAEGYLETRLGSGTYISEGVRLLNYHHDDAAFSKLTLGTADSNFESTKIPENRIRFTCGIAEASTFPKDRWLKRLQKEMWWKDISFTDYADVKGTPSLRETLAQHLLKSKYIKCDPEQIFVNSGTSQSIELLAKFFKGRKFNKVYLENPIVDFMPAIFRSNHYELCSIGVDEHGLQVEDIPFSKKQTTPIKNQKGLVVVTPSHQFPTGSMMPIQRRIQLVEVARESGSFIIEDDYDSEFKYDGVPIQSLQTLDEETVIHLGTFSKTLGAGLRLSYMVVPMQLVDGIRKTKDEIHMSTPTLDQEALSSFIKSGAFERHVSKMKKRYRAKMQHLTKELETHFGAKKEIIGNSGGMHLMVKFPGYKFDEQIREAFNDADVAVDFYSDYSFSNPQPIGDKLILGFGNLSSEKITEGVKRLATVLRDR